MGPCFPQDFSRFSAQTRVIAVDTIASYRMKETVIAQLPVRERNGPTAL